MHFAGRIRLSGGLCLRRNAQGGSDQQRSQPAEPLRMDDLILEFVHVI
jgi:hypothetical protein